MDYALIQAGLVKNIAVINDPSTLETMRSAWDAVEPLTDGCGVGWLWDGQEFMAPAIEPADSTPTACTRRQGRLALHQLGLLDAAEAAIESIEDPDQKRTAQIEYEADTWERSNAFVQQLWASLGGTPEGLDEAFELAVTL